MFGAAVIAVAAVTVYTSLPFDSIDKPQTGDVVKGEQMALEQANSQAGTCAITLKQLDDSTRQAGQWDPAKVSENARAARADPATIAYIGEYNSGASAISIPLLNQADVMQISPSNSALELTKPPGPTDRGAPNKYYPTGERTYARVAPADHIQAGALAEWMKSIHVKRLFEVDDKQIYGAGLSYVVRKAAALNGIKVVAVKGIDILARNYRGLAKKVRASHADAFFFGGITSSNAVRLYRDVSAANRRIALFGPDGVADRFFTRHLPKSAQRRMHITVGTYDPADYPGQQFYKDFKAKYGRDPEPYAIYGYESMSLLLDAMNRAGSNCSDRASVTHQVFATKNRQSVLGTYSIDKDGDVTTNRFGRYRVRRGRLVYDRAVIVKRDAFGNALG